MQHTLAMESNPLAAGRDSGALELLLARQERELQLEERRRAALASTSLLQGLETSHDLEIRRRLLQGSVLGAPLASQIRALEDRALLGSLSRGGTDSLGLSGLGGSAGALRSLQSRMLDPNGSLERLALARAARASPSLAALAASRGLGDSSHGLSSALLRAHAGLMDTSPQLLRRLQEERLLQEGLSPLSRLAQQLRPQAAIPVPPKVEPKPIPGTLPKILERPEDPSRLSCHQIHLRKQIEAFEATDDDCNTHTRGRNKPIMLGQVGIRCRHCAHLPVAQRKKGSTYFPANTLGLYQAAQNMYATHMQNGTCPGIPKEIIDKFQEYSTVGKHSSSGAGRPYWAESARKIGLMNTEENGIRLYRGETAKEEEVAQV